VSRQVEELPLVGIELNFKSVEPLSKQLYHKIKGGILGGRFKGGQKLPGTRTFSSALGISRNTVLSAFEQLMIEGYIKGKTGSGTYVAEDLPDKSIILHKVEPENLRKIKRFSSSINKNIGSLELIKRNTLDDELLPFQGGTPSLQDFPFHTWLKLINQVGRYFPYYQFGYKHSAGYVPLKEAIANYLQTYRAVKCNPDQIIIINGSQQGLDLVSRVLVKEKSNVLLEDPCYFGTRASLLSTKANLFPTPVDEEGISIDFAEKKYPKPNFVYTTPSHQFPLGSIMSISRRLELLDYARKCGTWIIEDDYDSEFRYSGSPLPSLQGMDEWNSVIYIGTFSKVLFPGLRLGYLVLPSVEMVNSFALAKSIIDRQSPTFEQIVLTNFITEGHFTRHIRRMRILYKERQEFLISELNKELGNKIKVRPSEAGMHIIVWLSERFSDKEVSEIAKKNKLIVYPVSDYVIKYKHSSGLVLGYTAFDKKKIGEGVRILKKVINSLECRK
jgi:GntR family transcriptional regulator / MocR family aminotransferase